MAMKLVRTLDSGHAPDLKAAINALAGDEPAVLDASEVAFVGQACLQLLLSAKAAQRITLVDPSEAFVTQCRLVGAAAPLALA